MFAEHIITKYYYLGLETYGKRLDFVRAPVNVLYSLLSLLYFPQGLETGCDFTKDGTVAIVQKTLQAMEGELEKKKKYDVQCNDPSCSFLVYFSQTRQADNDLH